MNSVLSPVNRRVIHALAETRADAKWMIATHRRYLAAVEKGDSPDFYATKGWRRALAQVLLRRLFENPWLLMAPLGALLLYLAALVFMVIW